MAADDFSLKRFLGIGHVVSVAVGAVIGLIAGPAGGADEAILRAIGGGFAGYFVSTTVYLFLLAKDLAALTIPEDELGPSEVVVRASHGSMVHFRSGRPLRFWEGVGGRLFLTSYALEFRAHRGQPWEYCVTIPLDQIASAEPCRILGFLAGGLRVTRVDGTRELFTFGVFGDAQGWTSAILALAGAARIQLRPPYNGPAPPG